MKKLRAVRKDETSGRGWIRELFEARDGAVQARTDAEKRVGVLTGKLAELQESLPARRQAVKDREYEWRMAQAKLDVHEATQEAVDAAEKAIEHAKAALEEAEGKIEASEDLIAEATNGIPSLKIAEEAATRRPWDAISEAMDPEVQEAVEVIRRFYVAELVRAPLGISADVFLRRVIPLGDVANIARELEAEYRR